MANILMKISTVSAESAFGAILRAARSVWGAVLWILLALAIADSTAVLPTVNAAADSFIGTFKFILFAVFLIAYLKSSGAEAIIGKAFAGRQTQMIFLAAFFGGLAPFCSCEVIPFIAGLLAVGVPLAPIMAFWLSSPLIDPPTLLITASVLGWEFAIAKAIAAVGLGLFGGFIVMFLMRYRILPAAVRPDVDNACNACGDISAKQLNWRVWQENAKRQVFKKEFIHNLLFLTKWLMLAYLLEALLVRYVPAESIGSVVGGEGLLPIVIAAFVGTPAYLNGFAAPPLIDGLLQQGMQNGAAFAFIISGSVTSIPAMAAVRSLVRWPVFMTYLGLAFSGAILSGMLFGYFT